MAYNNYDWHSNLNSHNNITLVDRVPHELLYLVDHHWYQFPPSKKRKNLKISNKIKQLFT